MSERKNWYKEEIIASVYFLRVPREILPDYPNYVFPDGRTECNVNLDRELMLNLGFVEMTDAEVAEWHTLHPKPVTVDDYDNAMENHLARELVGRGYTKRSPIEYTNSTNARWKQDALDWQAHLDEVMTYGLDVMNRHSAGQPVPTLEEFKAALPVIRWTVSL